MPKTGVIGGTVFFKHKLFEKPRRLHVRTPYGDVAVFVKDSLVFIPRHGANNNIPPHKINHHAHMIAFRRLGCTNLIGVSSCGALNKKIKIPQIMVPSDYINFDTPTYYDNKIVHITPGLDPILRKKIIKASKKLRMKILTKGIYVNTRGPRIETKAEISMFKHYGDVIGMTMAKEATLAKELDLNYAAMLSIDNYANGITKQPITYQQIVQNAASNSSNMKKLLMKALK